MKNEKPKFQVISGKMSFPKLTMKLYKDDPAQYSMRIANVWMNMLNELKRPSKFLKPTRRGTQVEYDYIREQKDYDSGLKMLTEYVDEINRTFDLGIKIGTKEEVEEFKANRQKTEKGNGDEKAI
ncbi:MULTISPECIES: hypothetical protein [unclassified Bacillus (in: firmicutes)]|uniref:hypothetical protein n=2 Tax=Bacillus TaxID=1386 RepID=UPI0013EED7C9|nr:MULTISPECIES: hypothetical protein [unclassified Bacillus (in: firmicutes)]KAF6547831.1 hypothetical protein G9F51_08600 [Bacillus sp. EKM207B]KAF6548904.1 hypothetical protein G9F50_07275 [Bacillus sp. EKM206B]